MFFTVSLYTALAIFLIGVIYKIGTWFTRTVGFGPKRFTTGQRLGAAARGIGAVIFSGRILSLAKVFVTDVLWQRRALKEDFLRWLMHMLIFWGFTLLLLMHALSMPAWFTEYYSTLHPFMFLRNLFGLMVIVGVGIAVYRRFFGNIPRLQTNAMDKYVIVLVGVILLSGFFLEAIKITSHSVFMTMVEDYGDTSDPEEIRALESFWVKNFGVVSPKVKGPFEEETLTEGGELHEMKCASCHSPVQWSFTAYPLARAISPIAAGLDRAGAPKVLWAIHLWACFIGLAYLPFSKMFHLIATPVSLLANGVMDPEKAEPANVMTRRVMELDACTHCGTCSLRCSALGAFAAMGNRCILPSEKMAALKRLASRKTLSGQDSRALMEGIYVCTSCDRCTVVCPSGINLKDTWMGLRREQLDRGYAAPVVLSPLSFAVDLNRKDLGSDGDPGPAEPSKKRMTLDFEAMKSPVALEPGIPGEATPLSRAGTFEYCFGCQNCSTVCPVVGMHEEPEKGLGLLPHQIMCCLGLGLTDMAAGSRMIWDCLTCYQCQEHCPQKVMVTDLLFALKNRAAKSSREH
jgi:heterodisulfide reductase subunit C